MKLLIAIVIVGLIGGVLFDSWQGILGLQAAFVGGYALTRVPSKAWLTLGEAFAEMLPWIMISTL